MVDADRTLGVNGPVAINAPDVDLAESLGVLPAAFLDVASLMRARCGARSGGERGGSFAVKGAGGIPAEPDGPLPARLASGPSSSAAMVCRVRVQRARSSMRQCCSRPRAVGSAGAYTLAAV